MKIAVIVPVYNGGEALRRCLESITGSRRAADQVIVADDGSTDDSAATVLQFGFELLRLTDGPQGPARPRNQGAKRASGADLLVFIDADVVLHPDTLTRIERHMLDAPDVAAVFGSYDDQPTARNIVSLYKNLLHHYIHQVSRREASTFWAGCGAIRREAFQAVGGFDELHTQPSIEDIELGARLRNAGYRIRLCPDVQVTHLKEWTLWSLIYTDIFLRAIPWSRLLMKEGRLIDDLNLSARHRLAAIASALLVFSGILVWWTPVVASVMALISTVAFVGLNFRMFRFFALRGGKLFVVCAAVLHLFYYLYSSVAFVWVGCETVLAKSRGKAEHAETLSDR